MQDIEKNQDVSREENRHKAKGLTSSPTQKASLPTFLVESKLNEGESDKKLDAMLQNDELTPMNVVRPDQLDA